MKKIITGIIIVLGLALAYYAISPLFRNVEVNDELPENIIVDDTSADTPTGGEVVQSGVENLSEEQLAEMNDQIAEANSTEVSEMDEVMPETVEVEIDTVEDAPPTANESFPVMGTLGHPAEGIVRVIQTTDGVVIRYENFKTINGPNLHVYLAKSFMAKEFIDLGVIKGTSGNINYAVPEEVDISEYRYVMYWCVPFKVLFNYADLEG